MKLIRESVEEAKVVCEESEGKKSYFIEGIFMQADLKNRNGRMYPLNILENEVGRYNKEYIQKNRAYGELGHPAGPTINMDRVSHMIKSLKREGNNFIGKAKIVDTPHGRIVESLLKEGANLGVSTRGVGTLKSDKDGLQVVQDDFMLSTAADIVADPSAPSAFVNGVMESANWVFDNGIWQTRELEQAREVLKKTPSRRLEEATLTIFKQFLEKL